MAISIHSPREGRDLKAGLKRGEHMGFQSTRPVRGETSRWLGSELVQHYFNPLAP